MLPLISAAPCRRSYKRTAVHRHHDLPLVATTPLCRIAALFPRQYEEALLRDFNEAIKSELFYMRAEPIKVHWGFLLKTQSVLFKYSYNKLTSPQTSASIWQKPCNIFVSTII